MAFARTFKQQDNTHGLLAPSNSEQINLGIFLENQANLKKMKHIRLQFRTGEDNFGNDMQDALDEIEKIKTFGELVNIFDDIMENYIKEKTDHSVKYKCMSLFLRPAALFSNGADFILQFQKLRDAAADVMVNFNYKLPTNSNHLR